MTVSKHLQILRVTVADRRNVAHREACSLYFQFYYAQVQATAFAMQRR